MMAALVTPGALRASGDDLPKAEAVLERYVEATGGRTAYGKLQNRVIKGTVEYVTISAKAEMTRYEASPAKARTIVQSPELGRMEEGVAGDVAWEITPQMGPRLKQGHERTDALRSAAFDGPTRWREQYQTMECVGTEMVDGKQCYKLVLTPASGNAETHYYDQASGLAVRMDTVLEHPMGRMNVEQYVDDYKPVDGILYPHTSRTRVAGQEMIMTARAVAHNVEIPDDRLTLPDEIQALVDQMNKPAPEGE